MSTHHLTAPQMQTSRVRRTRVDLAIAATLILLTAQTNASYVIEYELKSPLCLTLLR